MKISYSVNTLIESDTINPAAMFLQLREDISSAGQKKQAEDKDHKGLVESSLRRDSGGKKKFMFLTHLFFICISYKSYLFIQLFFNKNI